MRRDLIVEWPVLACNPVAVVCLLTYNLFSAGRKWICCLCLVCFSRGNGKE